MFPNPPGLLRPEPHSPGLRDRIWWGAGSRATAEWTAQQGMNMMSSTLMTEDAGVPFHELQAQQIRLFREAWTAAGNEREPRVSVSRSIFALVDDRDRAYFGRGGEETDKPATGRAAHEWRRVDGTADRIALQVAPDLVVQMREVLGPLPAEYGNLLAGLHGVASVDEHAVIVEIDIVQTVSGLHDDAIAARVGHRASGNHLAATERAVWCSPSIVRAR